MIDIYVATKKSIDNQNFAIVMIDEPTINYLYIQSLGTQPYDTKNAEILALETATHLATRLLLANRDVTIFYTLPNAVDENGNVRKGNLNDDNDRFYCGMESRVLENLLYIADMKKEVSLINLKNEENIALLSVVDNDLGYYVSIDDLQITDEMLADAFVSVVK